MTSLLEVKCNRLYPEQCRGTHCPRIVPPRLSQACIIVIETGKTLVLPRVIAYRILTSLAGRSSQSSVHLKWPLGGTITRGWSPFHFRLRVVTRLTFNDAGRVVHHRDLIDVKDLIKGFPGGTAFQWIAFTFAAQNLSMLLWFFVDRTRESEFVTNDVTNSTDEAAAVPSL